MTQRQVLNASSFTLHGSRLIEASAGTGKTWTIAALYVRLVLGHGGDNAFSKPLMPPDILVMTFTRAATRELSDRIRARLVDAVGCFRGERSVDPGDRFMQELLQAYPAGRAREHAAWRLAMAAECMDDAAIFTIDAWCQRMLREHAFDSGNLFDETLESDENQRLIEAAQDYWRQQCYPLQGPQLANVLNVWKSFEHFASDLAKLRPDDLACFDASQMPLQAIVQQASAAQQALVAPWQSAYPRFRSWLLQQVNDTPQHWNKTRFGAEKVAKWLDAFGAWVEAPETADFWRSKDYATARQNLCASSMLECRKKDAPAIALPAEAYDFEALAEQVAQLPDLRAQMLAHAAAFVHERMQWIKRQARSFGFADMLARLDKALSGENGAALRQRILQQYPVALIDEFQDTSPLQYRLFEQIYRTGDNDPGSALLLIGDPKQSIYGFRGADIYSYLRAREATAGRHYVLDVNFRSTQGVVSAVNHWFAQSEARSGPGAFMFREGAQTNPLPFDAVRANGRAERLQIDGQAVPAMTVVWNDAQGEAVNDASLLKQMAQACAEQVVQWLNHPKAGFVKADQALQRLRPCDMAVLVRTGRQAAAVRRELQRRHVASVYLSDQESVFASDEAQDLLYWLRAVAAPRDVRAVRAGLATRLIGMSLEQLAWLAANDEAFDAQSQIVAELHGVWQTQGVLAMLRQTLHRMALPACWLAEAGGERRLTNYLHLAELLQNASATLEGEQALIRWLATQVNAPGKGADEQVVRLESDADLVKIVTVHKSKGLEYPVVFLPFASDFRSYSDELVRVPQPDGSRRIELTPSEQALEQADKDRLREDIRLLYVALTRPRHALWVGMAAQRKGNSPKCVNHKGACGYLLNGGQEASVQGWLDAVQALAQGCSDICVQRLQLPAQPTMYRASHATAPLLAPLSYQASFDTHWGIGSFTRLVRGKSNESTVLPVAAMRPAEDERTTDNSPARSVLSAVSSSSAVWHRFMRGELVGNFIHEQLEWLEGEDFALEADGQGRLSEQLARRCERAGRAEQAQDTVQWLRHVVHHPLPPLGCSLAQLSTRLPEMEFWLPVAQLPARAVDALCRQYILPEMDRPVLPERSLHGMLMGFADLVFEHQGRYWVMDYKTNHLGADGNAYHAAALQQAMLQHRYDVQAALYMLALHQLLQSRLGDAYEPAQQLGGALYFFLRGMDGPAQGVHVVPPMLELLHALQALMTEVAA